MFNDFLQFYSEAKLYCFQELLHWLIENLTIVLESFHMLTKEVEVAFPAMIILQRLVLIPTQIRY